MSDLYKIAYKSLQPLEKVANLQIGYGFTLSERIEAGKTFMGVIREKENLLIEGLISLQNPPIEVKNHGLHPGMEKGLRGDVTYSINRVGYYFTNEKGELITNKIENLGLGIKGTIYASDFYGIKNDPVNFINQGVILSLLLNSETISPAAIRKSGFEAGVNIERQIEEKLKEKKTAEEGIALQLILKLYSERRRLKSD
jgi:hypothetical protein